MRVSDLKQEEILGRSGETHTTKETGPLFKLLFDEIISSNSAENQLDSAQEVGSLYKHTTDLGSIEHFLLLNQLHSRAGGSRRIKEYQRNI